MAQNPPKSLDPILSRIPVAWGKYVQVGPGWFQIILELDKKLSAIDSAYEVHQVKEKFGGLRYYCSLDGDDNAHSLIKEAELAASKTCEDCGAPGTRRGGGWIRTLCDGCYGSIA